MRACVPEILRTLEVAAAPGFGLGMGLAAALAVGVLSGRVFVRCLALLLWTRSRNLRWAYDANLLCVAGIPRSRYLLGLGQGLIVLGI